MLPSGSFDVDVSVAVRSCELEVKDAVGTTFGGGPTRPLAVKCASIRLAGSATG
jgi:hypothetical protein